MITKPPISVDAPERARKIPRQERSVALVKALREACLDILENEGRAALSVHAIADRAGVGVSSIYEYYPALEALVTDVFGDIRVELRAAAVERLHALPQEARLIDGIEMVLRVAVEMLERWGRIDRDVFVKLARYDELVRLDLILTEKTMAATIVDGLFARFDAEITVRDREKARFFTHQAILALMRAAALLQPEYLREDSTVEMVGRMIHALLTDP